MLLNLKIRDFAIIDAVEFELRPGFTVITGETGAGKSILVNALTLALGGRATTDIIRTGAEAAEVEALFDISTQPVVRARLEQRDLVGDDPNTLLIRRVIGPKGRAKVVVNGRLSTIASLAEVVRGLVDISGQHEQQSLLIVDNHIEILDAFGRIEELREGYRTSYDALKRVLRQRDELLSHQDDAVKRADYLRFQVEEIERLAPRAHEDEELQAERQRLAHADRLKRGVAVAEALLYGEDGSAFDRLSKATAEIEALARVDAALAPTANALDSSRREIQEAARELQRYATRIESDPTRLEAVDERLVELKRLCRKHGGDMAAVLSRFAELKEELDHAANSDEHRAELDAAAEELEAEALAKARELSAARAAAAERLDQAVVAEVSEMDLAGAIFRTAITTSPAGDAASLSPQGLDQIEFLWSANLGEPPRSLARIASGGELSRLMLAVKRVLSSRDLVSLYVFDEVDTGLGGRAADAIGRKIHDVAKDHQAITITHLAPIAARAHHHFCVRKETHGERTVSMVESLSGSERAEELARMIDGANITKATRAAAREMLARGG